MEIAALSLWGPASGDSPGRDLAAEIIYTVDGRSRVLR